MALIAPAIDDFVLRVTSALEPYLPDLVVAGGVAAALYRHHPEASGAPLPVVATFDLDCAVPLTMPASGRPPIEALLRDADLEEVLGGRSPPPLMKFQDRNDPQLELEFLAPLIGRSRVAARAVQPGVTAQTIRYLDLLLVAPWQIDLGRVPGFPAGQLGSAVRIPNPTAYAVQKLLNRRAEQNSASARDKDAVYVYEVAALFRTGSPALSASAAEVGSRMPPKWRRRFGETVRQLFGDVDAPGCRAVHRHFSGLRQSSPENPSISTEMVSRTVQSMASWIEEAWSRNRPG